MLEKDKSSCQTNNSMIKVINPPDMLIDNSHSKEPNANIAPQSDSNLSTHLLKNQLTYVNNSKTGPNGEKSHLQKVQEL